MRIEWINKKGGDRLILFFNGWGMDAAAVSHLAADCDVVMFYDYRTLECEQWPSFPAYREIYIVAWSMGVWAASNVLPLLEVHPVACVALNGTERPVHDSFGIPVQVYLLTENGMNERGREKFFMRMFSERTEMARFAASKPSRELPEQCEELVLIHKQGMSYNNCIKWDQVYSGKKDIIFPLQNQLNWWNGKAPVHILECGHYPFYCFETWEELIN